jgi:hypothetical protein
MKKPFLALILLSATSIFAQNGSSSQDRNQPSNHAPVNIQQSFQKDNPKVNNPSWSQSNRQWKANYRDNSNRNVDAYYDRQGNRKDTHSALDKKDVPRDVETRVNSRYNANGNYHAVRIERPDDKPLYQIKIQNGSRDKTVYFDEQGKEKRYNDRH